MFSAGDQLELFVIKGLADWIAMYLQGVSNITIWSAIDSPPDTVENEDLSRRVVFACRAHELS